MGRMSISRFAELAREASLASTALSTVPASATRQALLDPILDARLRQLQRQNRFRDPEASGRERAEAAARRRGVPFLDASSNDYLGLAAETGAAPCSGLQPWGAGASRLIHGTHSAHAQLEAELARWLGREASLLFSSGYAANVGTVACLAVAGDLLISDALNHASLIDGCRLSGARRVIIPHRDVNAVERALRQRQERTAWVVTESYFSMDGDVAPLDELARVCRRHGAALIVDEAHALGVFGPAGRGLAAHYGVEPDVTIGTFGKAFAAQGAFVAGSRRLRDWLWNSARSFVFSTATSPALASYLRQQLERVSAADRRRAQLHEACRALEQQLRRTAASQFALPEGRSGPIFPLICGSAERALAAAEQLLDLGILTQAIRPPTVPEGESRLRLSLQATITAAQLDHLFAALANLP